MTRTAASVVAGDAVFAGALPDGQDVRIGALAEGFKSSAVLHAYAAGAGSYSEQFVVPAGVIARSGGPGVELEADGKVVGSYGSGMATDSASPPTAAEVVTSLVGQSGSVVTVGVSVDDGWLRDAQRVFPVTIDPVFVTSAGQGAVDTYVKSDLTTSQYNSTAIVMGVDPTNAFKLARGLLRFNVASIVGPNRQVSEAHINVNTLYSVSCTTRPVEVRNLLSGFGSSTVWSNQPAMGSVVSTSTPFAKGGGTSCPAGIVSLDATSAAQGWVNGDTNNGLMVKAVTESDNQAMKWFSSAESSLEPALYVTYNRPPTNATPAAPADAAELTTTTPTLTVNPGTDPDGDPLQYFWSVSTNPDGVSGQVLSSGWQPAGQTSWTVPAGTLVDGTAYYWMVYTSDGKAWPGQSAARGFSINMRLGEGKWPTDQLGPATVNLTNGNLTSSTASPSFPTVGGSLGLSYSYNSKAEATNGLSGAYYDLSFFPPANHTPAVTDQPALVRRDPLVSFVWGTGSPWAPIHPDNFYVKWTGYVTVPTTGSYNFGASSDDGSRIKINGTTVFDGWAGPQINAYGTAATLTAGQAVPIQVEQWEGTGNASISLRVKGPGLSASGSDVSSSWLSTNAPTLPTGWTVSADLDGDIAYRTAQVTSNAITVTDLSGATHRYTWNLAINAYQPPTDEHGVIATNPDGTVTLLDDDGKTYTFAATGALTSVTSATDDKHPAAPVYTYTGTPPRLTTVTDPVSGKAIGLHYAGDSTCTTATGFVAAPPGNLCAVDYTAFGSGTTQIRYNSNGQLARMEDPGAEVTDYAYTSGRLAKIRDPLAADTVAAGLRAADDTTNTLITYDSNGGVNSIKLAEPQTGEARPEHTYTLGATSADVQITGMATTAPAARHVTWDTQGRPTTEVDQAGHTTTTVWDPTIDQILATTDDATGLKTTTIYDTQGNPTDTWGPAPSSWWPTGGNAAPSTANQAATPHTTNRYDEGLTSLAATWWNNPTFAGPPTAHATGIGGTTGELSTDWGTGQPAGLTSPDFSGRLTGYINVTSLGAWNLQIANLQGKARLYIDNTLVVDGWNPTNNQANGTYTAATTGWKPITIEYANPTGNASLDTTWRQGTNPYLHIPAANLTPGYNLETSATDPDGNTTATGYTDTTNHIDTYLGLPVTDTVDPGAAPHLNLTTTTGYEDPTTSGYLRRTSRTLPSGPASTIGTDYWGDQETADIPCPGGATAINQDGQLHRRTSADPDGSGPGAPAVEETVYDQTGRPAATRAVADGSNWTCTTYDTRGRATATVYPDLPGVPGHTVTTDYAVTNNPLVTQETDTPTGGPATTITSTVDLLGRTRTYTDTWNNTTNTTYDQAGRTTATTGPVGTLTSSSDTDGNAGPTVLNGATLATPHYDTAGRLDHAEYANGTKLDPITRDSLGRDTSLTWRKTDSTLITSDAVTRRLGGDISNQITDGHDPHPGDDYTYDSAGRLTDAWTTNINTAGTTTDSRHRYSYDQLPAGTCPTGTQPAAGRNTTRTTSTEGDDPGATNTTYCYDNADRLVSASDPTVGTPAYDTHGNTTTIHGETHTYDSSDRHFGTTKNDTTVTYQRDATDRIVARTSTTTLGGTPTIVRYGYTGDGDSPDLTLDTSGTVLERTIPLPGGITLTERGASGQVWSHPSIHGDTAATTDSTGTKQGPTLTYDPYGYTTSTLPDNSNGNLDYGWLGQHQRPQEHETGLTTTTEMGARQYDPTIGRFLQNDPIEGGSANDYDYVSGDPINSFDLDGNCKTHHKKGLWGWVRSVRCRASYGVRRARHYYSNTLRRHGCLLGRRRNGSCWGAKNFRGFVSWGVGVGAGALAGAACAGLFAVCAAFAGTIAWYAQYRTNRYLTWRSHHGWRRRYPGYS